MAGLLDDRVSFRSTSVDRIGLRGSSAPIRGRCGKFLVNSGDTIPSSDLLNRNHERLVAELEALVARTSVPVVRFKTGLSKEDLALGAP